MELLMMQFIEITGEVFDMASEEHNIQRQIQVALSQHKCSVFRTNVGKVQTIDHRWFDTGLPQGHFDLYGFRWVDNRVFYIEVKSKTGKPREDQIRFHEFLASHGVIHGIARSVSEARQIVDGAIVGFGFDDYGSDSR